MEYEAPRSLAGLMKVLAGDPSGSLMVAGGQSILPHLARRAEGADYVAPRRIVDLSHVAELRMSRLEGAAIFLGAGLTVSELLRLGVGRRLPVLEQALLHIGNVTIRNRATVGGCLAWGDARAELPLVALLYGATVITSGGRIAMADFCLGLNKTALMAGDVILGVEIPVREDPAAFLELMPRRSFGRAVLSLAGLRTGDGLLRLALGGLVDRPVLTDGLSSAAWLRELPEIYPVLHDPVFPVDYRRAMAERLLQRMEEMLP